MGPKSAKKGKDKKKDKEKSSSGTPGDLDSSEKLGKTTVEIDLLLRELQHHNSLADRLRSANGMQKERIESLEGQLECKQVDRLEITSDMSRQYKSMQAEMSAKINALEGQVADLKKKLAQAQEASQESTKEYLQIIAIKDEVIEEQNVKMSYMSAEFESMLNETLAKMSRKLDIVSNRWKENDNTTLSEGNSRKLADFHLNRLISRQEN